MIKKFLKSIAILCALVIVAAMGLNIILSPWVQDKNAYLAATIDKEKLLENIPGPRIVFVGASNLAFGLDSKRISDSLHLPVVNMGLHGGLGLDFALKEAKAGIKKGDIVVVCTTYYLKNKGKLDIKASLLLSNPAVLDFLDYSSPDFIRLYCAKLQQIIVDSFYFILKKVILPPQEKVYLRSSFNATGDIVSPYIDSTKYRFDLITGYPDSYEEEIQNINGFIECAELKGAKVFYMFPNSPETLARTQQPAIKKLERNIYSGLNCPVLNTTQAFVFPDSLCYDSMFHLNRMGKNRLTGLIIDTLRPIVKRDAASPELKN